MKKKLHFVVVASQGSFATTVYGPIELVQACRRLQADLPELEPCEISTEILSLNGEPFESSLGYRQPVDGALKDLPPDSVIFVPGFGLPSVQQLPELMKRHTSLGTWLKRQHAAGCTIVAATTANLLLAENHLLPNKKATIFWAYAELFRRQYPHIHLDVDAPVVEDDRVFSVGGAFCGLDAILAVIERYIGREVARLCAKLLVIENRRPSELRYEKRQPVVHNDPHVDRAVGWIRSNLHTRLTIESLLRQVPMSRRSLSRRFKTETGEGIQSFIQRLRIDRAKLLLETSSLPIEQIVAQVGYHDTSAFARQFKRATRVTPNQYRQRYGLSGGEGERYRPASDTRSDL